MGSAGHADNSIGNYTNNRNLLKSNSNRYAKVKEAYLKAEARHQPYTNKNHLEKEELEIIRLKIRGQIIRERRRKILLTTLLTPFALAAITLLIRNLLTK